MSAATGLFGKRLWAKMPSVHIMAPICKWLLVIAGLKDLQRPVDKLSGTQNLALMATGAIWTRWAGFVIQPRNPLLASVNFFLGIVGATQLGRIVHWRHDQGDTPKQIGYYIVEGTTAPGAKPVEASEASKPIENSAAPTATN